MEQDTIDKPGGLDSSHMSMILLVSIYYFLDHCCPVNRIKKGLNLSQLLQCECEQTL